MKKKRITWLLAFSLCAASVSPVYGAEFISSPAQTSESFFDGPTQETEFTADTPAATTEASFFSTEEEPALSVIQLLKIKDTSKKAKYWTGLDTSDLSLDEIGFDGLELEITYEDSSIETVAIDHSQQTAAQDGKYFFQDKRGNSFYLEWADPVNFTKPGFYSLKAKAQVVTVNENGEEEVKLLESAPFPFLEIANPAPEFFPKVTCTTEYGKKTVTAFDVTNKKARAVFTPAKDGFYKFTRNDVVYDKYQFDPTCVFDKNADRMNSTCNITFLKGGETYYILSEEPEKSSLELAAEYVAPVTSMELVKKPSHNDLFIRKNSLLDGPFFHNGQIKLTYADGSSEIISTDRKDWNIHLFNKYGFSLKPSFSSGSGWNPKEGLCDYILTMEETGMKLVIPNVEIKSASKLPTVKEKGTVKAKVNGSAGAWIRLKTGKNRFYKIQCLEGKDIILEDENGYSYMDEPSNQVYELKPDSLYYIRNTFHDTIPQEELTYKITPASGKTSISDCRISLRSAYAYTGKALKPSVKITDKGTTLKANKDYKISYSNNQNIGVGKIKITGIGSYKGSVTKSFKIVPARAQISYARRTSSSQVTLKWSKSAGAARYVIFRTTDGKTWTKLATTGSTAFTDKKAKKGPKYQYKIRPYKRVGKSIFYGSYSSVKTVK